LFYAGRSSFEGPEQEYVAGSRERGWFTCIAEAESVDDVVDKFRELVGSLKSWFTSFEDVEDIFLDDITEVETVPREGGVERRLHVGPDRAGGQLQVQVCPGASARVREPVTTENAGLDPVAWIVAEYGVYREGVGPQRIQRQTEL
jgi:hypothetical protein